MAWELSTNVPAPDAETGVVPQVIGDVGLSQPVEDTSTPDPAPADADPEPQAAAADDHRDGKGRFQPRSPRDRRPESHRATAHDVPRIHKLTAQAKTAEEKAAAAEAKVADLERRLAQHATAPAPSPAPVVAAPAAVASDRPAKPDHSDSAKYPYGTADPQYIEDFADWKYDVRRAAEKADDAKFAEATRVREEAARISTTFNERCLAAEQKYSDFKETVTAPKLPLRPDSPIALWITDRPSGPDIWYHLEKHPDEFARLNALAVMDQIEELTLLGQRLTTSSKRGQAGPTGAATASIAPVVPKPPTPVRTGPVNTGDTPPGDDASIREHRAYWHPDQRRARR